MAIERRGPDTIGARTVLAPWWTDHVRDTHRPCTTPNCAGARYVDGLCKRCWHAQIGRNSAAYGAGDGASRSQDLNDQPSPAPVYSPEVQEHERQRLHDLAEDYMREAAEEADDKRRAAAPSLPMDLCSDIPEDDQ